MISNRSRMSALFLSLLVTDAAFGEPAMLSVQVDPSWSGLARSGSVTEIGVRLVSEHGGVASISLPGHTPVTSASAILSARVPHTVYIPVRVHDPRLTVEVRLGDSAPVEQTIEFRLVPPEVPLAAVITDVAVDTPAPNDAGPRMFRPTTGSLPRHFSAYESIDVLVIEPAMLSRLDERQARGLQTYLEDCGRTLVLDASSSPALDSFSGCDGALMMPIVDASEVREAIDILVARTTPTLISASELRSTGNGHLIDGPWRSLAIFFGLYFTALVLLARNSPRPLRLLLLPVGAVLVALVAWPGNSADQKLIVWSETHSGDRFARFSALLNIEGRGPGEVVTRIPSQLGTPRATGDALVRQHIGPAGPTDLTTPVHLLSHASLGLRGTVALRNDLVLEVSEGIPFVRNDASAVSTPAMLGWNGRRFDVPAIEPGQYWRPEQPPVPWDAADAAQRLLRGKTESGHAALMLPLPDNLLTPPDAGLHANGWLLIHAS